MARASGGTEAAGDVLEIVPPGTAEAGGAADVGLLVETAASDVVDDGVLWSSEVHAVATNTAATRVMVTRRPVPVATTPTVLRRPSRAVTGIVNLPNR